MDVAAIAVGVGECGGVDKEEESEGELEGMVRYWGLEGRAEGKDVTNAPARYTPPVRVLGLLSQAGLGNRNRRWPDIVVI